MADHENELNVTLTFAQLCAYTEAARQGDPYRAPEVVLGEWLTLAGITPAPNLDVRAAAERALLRKALELFDLEDPNGREVTMTAPEDREILALCERLGFGAVMHSASRQWRRRDPKGAFTVGTCAIFVRDIARDIRRVLKTATPPRAEVQR